MKNNIQRLIILFAIMFTAAGANAQRAEKLRAEDGLFNHLSVGLFTGLTGFGIDAAMPVCKIVTVRAGFSSWGVGNIDFKAINTATEITETSMVEDDAVRRSKMEDKIELQVKPRFWNFFILGEVHPFKEHMFYFSAGLFFGSQTFIHFHDKDGNVDVRMKTNAVKPYIGIGFGQHLAKNHRVSVAVDLGLLFWGTPKFLLNNDTEIKSSGSNSGITGAISWLKAWPNLSVRVAYKIF